MDPPRVTGDHAASLISSDFFQPVHLHSELADLHCVSCFFFALLGEFFFKILLPRVVKDHRSFLKEFLLPVPEEVRLNVIFGSNDVPFLFPLQNLKDEIRLIKNRLKKCLIL